MGIEGEYTLFSLPDISEMQETLQTNTDLRGFNVTIPYKEDVIGMLDWLSEDAREIGAINTVKIIYDKNGARELRGYNTDSPAFKSSLQPLLHPKIRKALIFGTGGASKAVGYALRQLGIEYECVSRNPKSDSEISYSEIDVMKIRESLLLINATPVGMYPKCDTTLPLPYDAITEKHVCYDLIYNPEETEFLRKSRLQKATTKNGLEMLHLQAELAWEIWQKE